MSWLVPGQRPALAAPTGVSLFCPCWGDMPKSEAAWDAAARNHAIIAGLERDIPRRADRLHSINPSLKLLIYNPGPYLPQGTAVYERTMREHPEYFARDKDGKLITVPRFPKLTLMDQGVEGWRSLHAELALALVDRGVDGVYVDSLGAAPTAGGGYTTGKPINQRTKQPYTAEQWVELSRISLDLIKDTVGSKFVMFNGLISGTRYGGEGKIFANSKADGGMAEAFMRQALSSSTKWPTATQWKAELDMVVDMAAKGKAFFGWTKVWTNASERDRAAWHNLAMATYLLGREENSYYNFLPQDDVDRTQIFYANQQAALGLPKGPYSVRSGVYVREFANGTVSVNPATRAVSISVKTAK